MSEQPFKFPPLQTPPSLAGARTGPPEPALRGEVQQDGANAGANPRDLQVNITALLKAAVDQKRELDEIKKKIDNLPGVLMKLFVAG